MDGARVTVKEAWVKAKEVCRKKGVQMVLLPLPLPLPHFPTLQESASCQQHEASTQQH